MNVARLTACLIFLAAAAVLLVACGGSDPTPVGDIMEFDDEEPVAAAPPPPGAVPLLVDPVSLEEISYLYGHQVFLESLAQSNRDLSMLLEESRLEGAGLQWVIDTYEMDRDAQAQYEFYLTSSPPQSQFEKHLSLYQRGVQIVQVMAFGSERLLLAAVTLGPSGRSIDVMPQSDAIRFRRLAREAGYFFRDAGELIQEELGQVEQAIREVHLGL